MREGRVTASQKKAMETLWPIYGVGYSPERLNLDTLFGRNRPVTLEIGFGNGDSLVEMARNNPDNNYLGVEVYTAGVGHCLIAAKQQVVDNLRIISHDAIEILNHQIDDGALGAVQLFFPDPWPKKKHHKRRIINAGFIALLQRKIKSGGLFHFATDWQPYADWALEHLEATDGLVNLAGKGEFLPRPEYRPVTKFEKRGLRLGHGVWDLMYENSSAS
ncbi:MAG: tRNA (guanine-N7-)-methyltransferase [Neolewinella sp.]|jgi:tRNA (guanine-N7-)-methyltransferase